MAKAHVCSQNAPSESTDDISSVCLCKHDEVITHYRKMPCCTTHHWGQKNHNTSFSFSSPFFLLPVWVLWVLACRQRISSGQPFFPPSHVFISTRLLFLLVFPPLLNTCIQCLSIIVTLLLCCCFNSLNQGISVQSNICSIMVNSSDLKSIHTVLQARSNASCATPRLGPVLHPPRTST